MNWFKWPWVQQRSIIIEAEPPKPVRPREGRLDQYSGTWEFISKWLEDDLVRTRESNDSTKKTEQETAVIRGRIKLIKELLALPSAKIRKKQIEDDPNDY